MKKDVKFITEEQALRYMPNDYFQKDAFWNKVRSTIDNNKFAGNFYCSLWQGGGDGYLYELDEHDDYLVRRQNLKEGERIYRYFTRRSAFTGQVPLIKINIDKGLLYFLKEDEEGLDLIEFETKGIPVRYLNIISPQKEEYAEGGITDDEGNLINLKVGDNVVQYKERNSIQGKQQYGGTGRIKLINGAMARVLYENDYEQWVAVKDLKKMADGGMMTEGGELKDYLSSRKDMFDDNAKTITKKDIIEVISLSKNSDKKYWVKDLNTKYSYYIYKGNLRANDGTGGIFSTTIISPNYLKDEHRFKVEQQSLYDWEKESDPSIVKVGWDAIKQKFDKIFYMEQDGDDEIFANEVKLEEPSRDAFGNMTRFTSRVSFADAKSMFLRSLTPEEKAMVDIEYNYKNVNELFGLMYEKKIMVKRKNDSLYMKNGGKLAWQNVQVGDKALVISENKLGLVMKPYGRRFHLRFPDGTEKTYSAEELEFFKDEEYAEGGGLLMIPNNMADEIKKSISMGYDIIREGLISPKRKGIMLSNEDYKVRGTFPLELKNAIQKMIDDSKMKKGGTLEGGVKKNMLFDKNGERRIDPEAIAYIENTVEMLPQTKFMYTTDDGKYKPERKKLHDEIIATFHEGKPCINKRPAVAILTGGAPASGKTTFIKKYVDLDPEKVYHVDADEVRAMLPEYRGWNATQTHLETADIVNRLIDDIGVPCDHDLIYDGTMNKATKYEKIVEKLHKLGYKVFVVYISIPEQVSKERVIARYKKAGRYVPMKVIEEVYDMGLTAFEKVAHEMADGYIRIDGMNGEIIEEGGMAMPSNIEYEKGGKIDDNKLKNATALVRSAERFAEMETGKPVKKGRGMASASISDGKRKYKSVTVFFEDGTITTFEEEEFPKFFMKDGGELGSQDYYDGFQMQVVQKKGNPDKEVQKENIKMSYRKGGKL
jgi:predicted ABC-type ATPase